MKDDPETMKGGAYFKDPGNKQNLTGEEPREIACCITDTGKFVWPQIKFSNVLSGKIVYSLWTADEKAIYKQYRSGGTKREKKEKPVIKQVTVTEQTEESTHSQVEHYKEPDYDNSVASENTLAYIKNCDEHLGVWFIDGIIHDLLSTKGSNSYRAIPRCIIPAEDRRRFNIG